jgi:hypothetical protein
MLLWLVFWMSWQLKRTDMEGKNGSLTKVDVAGVAT